MDSFTTYSKTARGLRALVKKLPDDAGLVLSAIDKELAADELKAKLADMDERSFDFAVKWLLEGGFIKSTHKNPFPDSGWSESKNFTPVEVNEIGIDEFTVTEKVTALRGKAGDITEDEKAGLDEEKRRLEQADAEARLRAEAAIKANQEDEALEAEEEGRRAKGGAWEQEAAIEQARMDAIKSEKEEAEAETAAQQQKIEEAAVAKQEQEAKEELARLEAEAQAEQERAKAEERLKSEQMAVEKQEEEAAIEQARMDAIKSEKEKAEAAKALAKEQAALEAAAKKEEKARLKSEKKAAAKAAAEQKAIKKAAAKEQALLEAAIRAEGDAAENAKTVEGVTVVPFLTRAKDGLFAFLRGIRPLSIYALGVFLLLVFAAQFINFRTWVAPLEGFIAERTQGKVNIETVRIALFPSPHLVLEGLNAIDSTTIKAKKIHVYPTLANIKEKLFGADNIPYRPKSILIEDFGFSQKDIPALKSWAGHFSNDKQFTVNKVAFKNMAINLNSATLPKFNGEILLDNTGLLMQGRLLSESQNLKLAISNTEGKYLINLSAKQWRAPLAPFPVFKELNANGSINEATLSLPEINGVIYKGRFEGALQMDLKAKGLTSTGELKVSNLMIEDMVEELKINAHVEGKLSSNGKFSFDINKDANRIEKTALNAAFDIKSGQLNKVDLIEAMRSGGLSGSTKFTLLSGFASRTTFGRHVFSNLKLRSNQLQASGQVVITADKQTAANVATRIATKQNEVKSQLQIGGPLTALKLKN